MASTMCQAVKHSSVGHLPDGRVGIISGTERRNGTTVSRSRFYKNMIIYGTERRNTLWLAGTEP